MKIKRLKEIIIRRNGEKKEYVWEVKQIDKNKYYCPQLDFSFNPETGETDKQQGIGKGMIKIGETFEYAGRKVTYELIIEEEEQKRKESQEQSTTSRTTLVKEWRYEDGTIEEKAVYTGGQLWEKGGHKRMYFNTYGRGAYVDLKTNTFHPNNKKAIPIGVWEKPWGSKVEVRWRLK